MMREDDDPRALFAQKLQRLETFPYAKIVDHDAVCDRHIEIETDKRTFAGKVLLIAKERERYHDVSGAQPDGSKIKGPRVAARGFFPIRRGRQNQTILFCFRPAALFASLRYIL